MIKFAVGGFVAVLLMGSPTSPRGDFYVKGILHIQGGYRYGHNVPDTDVVEEWWFTKDKVAFSSTGWRFDYSGFGDWRLVLDNKGRRMLAVNLTGRTFVEIPLPMELAAHVDPLLPERLKEHEIDGRVVKTEREEGLLGRSCAVYEIAEWMIQKDDRFYDRRRKVACTTDLAFDWKLAGQINQWVASFYNPRPAYLEELGKVQGFILASEEEAFEGGSRVLWTFRVTEMIEKKPPDDIFSPPQGFEKKGRLSARDLSSIRGMVYGCPLY